MRKKSVFSIAKFTVISLLLLSVLLTACSKEGNEEGPEAPLGPYELSVYPPRVVFYSNDFRRADADESVFVDTLFIKGGTPPYRVEPQDEIFDFVTVRSAPLEADHLIIKYVYHKYRPAGGPDFLLFSSLNFVVYDKNGGYAKFEVWDHDSN